jgi:hypothetical protein
MLFVKGIITKVNFNQNKDNNIYIDVKTPESTHKNIFVFSAIMEKYMPKINDEVYLYRPNGFLGSSYLFALYFPRKNETLLQNGEGEIGTDDCYISFLKTLMQLNASNIKLKSTNKIDLIANANINISKNISDERAQNNIKFTEVINVLTAIKDIPELATAKPIIQAAITNIQNSQTTSTTLKTSFDSTYTP